MVARRGWLEAAARAGYTAKGVVYVMIGGLAVAAATGQRGRLGGGETAVRAIGDQSYGRVLLALTAAGLFGYALWRLVSAAFDVEDHGKSARGMLARAAQTWSGLVYGALGVLAVQIASGSSGGGSSERTYVSKLLSWDGGAIIVGVIGVIVLAYSAQQLHKAMGGECARVLSGSMPPRVERWGVLAGRAGIGARAVVLIIVGLGILRAAFDHDPSEAHGIGGALASIARQPYGVALLLAVAVGLVAYGVYQFVLARYRRIPAPAR
jgi:hypothetical protein